MIVYHGSDREIIRPRITLSDLGREFGIGFYVTPELTLAESQAKRKAKQGLVYDAHRPVVTEFEFDADAAAKALKLKRLDGCSEEWLDFIMRCYTDIHFVHPYDIVIGNAVLPEHSEILNQYRRSVISKQLALKQLNSACACFQICFSTAASLDFLKKR